MDDMNLGEEFLALLENAARESGKSLAKSAQEVADYTAARAAHLATLVNQPGFAEAVTAERDNVCLFAGIRVVREADAADARVIGIVTTGLSIGARALALLAA